MNDGIYYPFSEDRFKKYQEGMLGMLLTAFETGAKVVVVTLPPFDPAAGSGQAAAQNRRQVQLGHLRRSSPRVE